MAPLKCGQKNLKENQDDIYTKTHKIRPGEVDISKKNSFWATLIYIPTRDWSVVCAAQLNIAVPLGAHFVSSAKVTTLSWVSWMTSSILTHGWLFITRRTKLDVNAELLFSY